ncbi:essential MCU regulator, mitochondrial-like [Arapaima gigas]
MASSAARFLRLFTVKNTGVLSRTTRIRPSTTTILTQSRTAVTTSTGAILPKPNKVPFGLMRITIIVVPFLYVGTVISKNFAELLEEHDIFVPDNDDDD